ncbi:hypothetical protein [uncultured Bifidobacterium sp.]|uniref:hypothetical protein n=1 Tax=uncultured Bifidobacterium sp. TaxID=165187 RepID=UPI00263436BC|nr:hypothetical protein [uncultured Bifidobacterium sp.]
MRVVAVHVGEICSFLLAAAAALLRRYSDDAGCGMHIAVGRGICLVVAPLLCFYRAWCGIVALAIGFAGQTRTVSVDANMLFPRMIQRSIPTGGRSRSVAPCAAM